MDRRELFVSAAAAVLAQSRGREQGLLAEGTQGPDFTTDGLHLRQFRDRHRVVIVFGPPARYLEDVAAHREQYADRDLVVLAFAPSGTPDITDAPALLHVLPDTPDIAALYRAGEGMTAFYLIGKDGHVALARRGIPPDTELFALIDAMPMRRQEMRERNQ